MSTTGSQGVALAYYESIASHDHDAAVQRTAEHVQLTSIATGDLYTGRRGLLEFVRGWTAAFPDLRFSALSIGGDGSRVVVEYRLEGTQTGPLVTPRGHIPPTGMEVQLRFCDVVELHEGRITAIRSYYDTVTMLGQLGLSAGTPLHAADRRAVLDLYAQPVDGNAPQRHKGIVTRYLQEVFNRQNPAAALDTCRSDYVWHGGTLGEARGLDSYRRVLASLFLAFPDLQLQVLDTVAEGDRVVVRFSLGGTHLGRFQEIAPTGNRVASGGTATFRIEDSWIVEEWWQADLLMLRQQIDAVPGPPPRSS